MVEQAWEYDRFGNIVLQKEKPYTHQSWINNTVYMYDPSGRHVTKVVNPLQQETTYADFHVSGKPQTITDYKGNVTNYTYDAFGRFTGAVYPDDVTEQQTIAWNTESGALYSITGTKIGAPQTVAYYDAFNRLIKQSTQGFDGSLIYTDNTYDTYGRLSEASEPYTGNAAARKTRYTYDTYDRIKTVQTAQGKIINYTYSGNNITESDGVLTTTKIYDVRGQLMGVSGSHGIISYTYRPDGQPTIVKLNNGVATSFEYDAYGRQTAIVDPAAGRQRYSYDSRGNLTQQTDANGKTVTTTYNDFGQPLTRTTPEYAITYNYTDDYLLSSVTCGNAAKYFTYDNLGRVLSESETVDNISFAKTFSYNQGKMAEVLYSPMPNTPVAYTYNDYGYLKEITAGGTPAWQLTSVNQYGQPLQEALGNNLLTYQYKYSAEGLPAERIFQKGSTTIQRQQYEFDALKSNLNSRTNHYGAAETFEHDALSQLKRVSAFGGNVEVQYDALGNITQKTDVGTYGYNVSNNPYAISGINGAAGVVPSLEQHVTYTSFRRPATIEEENGHHTSFTYNADWQRVKMDVQLDNASHLTRYYLSNNYEKDVTPDRTVERIYIGGTAYHAPAVFIKENSGAWALHYIMRDHLGSVTGLTDEDGTPVAEYSYDPWGRLRDPQTLQVYAPGQEPALWLGRGFTGHEHLPWHGLINMNARLYDPLLGRFLAPDPYVQFPDIVRSYNRYSYCMNNPLVYVDENGEFPWLIVAIGAVIGAYSGGVIANDGEYNPFKWDYNSGQTWSYMLGGAIVGGVSGYAGWAIAGSGIPMANTAAIAGSSLINSVGTWAYTGGQTPISISFGVASYDFTNGTFGYLGKKGNKWYENLGYGLGALANVSDILAGFNPGEVQLQTENTSTAEAADKIGHSQILDMDGNSLIDFGPGKGGEFYQFKQGRNNWISYASDGTITQTKDIPGNLYTQGTSIKGVNLSRITSISNNLNKNPGFYNFALRSCSSVAARILTVSGAPMFGIHPYILQLQASLWSAGIRPWTFSYFLNQQY